MSYLIKQVASPESGKINKGVFAIDLDGPTSSGMVSGITPPSGSVVVISEGASNDPDFWIVKRGQDLVNFGIYTLGLNGNSTEADVLDHIGGQNDLIILDSLSGPGQLDSTLVTHLDASIGMSYPKAGGAWYDLTGDATATFTLSNGPTFTGKYFSFDGSNDHARTNNPNLDFGPLDAYTLDFLVKIPDDGANQTILLNGDQVNNGLWFFKHRSGLGNRLVTHGYAAGQSRIDVITDNPIPNDQWTRCSLTYEGGIYQLYLNGVPDGPEVNAYPVDQHGGSTYLARIGGTYMQGNIAEGRVYHRRLEPEELLKNYYQSNTVQSNLLLMVDSGNLISFENGNSTIYSLTGGHSGTLNNGVEFADENGGILVFDGTNDNITIGTVGGYSNQITCEAWFKTTSNATWKNMLCGSTGDIIFTVNGSKLNFGSQGSNPIPHANYSISDVNDGKWHHGVATYDGSNVKIFIDGKIEATYARSGNQTPSSLRIGSNNAGSSEFFDGELPIVKLYDRALSDEEILQNYRAYSHRFEHELGSPGLPAESIDAILAARPNAPNGVYHIKPPGYSGPAFGVYCDMDGTASGIGSGGWYRIDYRQDSYSQSGPWTGTGLSSVANPAYSGNFIFSLNDSEIQSLLDNTTETRTVFESWGFGSVGWTYGNGSHMGARSFDGSEHKNNGNFNDNLILGSSSPSTISYSFTDIQTFDGSGNDPGDANDGVWRQGIIYVRETGSRGLLPIRGIWNADVDATSERRYFPFTSGVGSYTWVKA